MEEEDNIIKWDLDLIRQSRVSKMTEKVNAAPTWEKLKVLGRGAFGEVTLWQKKNSSKLIAIKIMRETDCKDDERSKIVDKWCNEVKMMEKLSHPNIVQASPVPEQLTHLSKYPILAMEYCALGDLREVLQETEHCCGLPESTIIKILKDVSKGLEYLHSCRVIHRDLKPDNIVLQGDGSEITYKIIDLGFAKELGPNSLCKSFVGTVEYLAPEIFLGTTYTKSVDYWSFGVLAHEIITGYKPFLPGSTPAEWMERVQNKARNIISITENLNGETIFSSTISRINNVNRCLLVHIEKWLRMALDWNAELRGRDVTTKELVFFSFLNEILEKRTVKIFSLPTYEILCYEITPGMDVAALKVLLEKSTGINADEQILLFRNGHCLESSGIVLNYLKDEPTDSDRVSVFLYSQGLLKIKSRVIATPLNLKELMDTPNKAFTYPNLLRTSSDMIFLLQTELYIYTCLLRALRVKISNLQARVKSVENLYQDVANEWNQVENFAQFLMMSHKADLENYISLRKGGELQTCDLVQKWIAKVTSVEKELSELRKTSNRNKLKLSVAEAKAKCKDLEANDFLKSNNHNCLKELIKEAGGMWKAILNVPKETRHLLTSNPCTVELLYRCNEYTRKLLRNPALNHFFQQLLEAEEHLTKIVFPLTLWLKNTKVLKQIIEDTQKQRQKEIWNLIVNRGGSNRDQVKSKADDKAADRGDGTESKFSPFHIPKTVQSEIKATEEAEEEVLRPNFMIMEPVSVDPFKLPQQAKRPDIWYSAPTSLATGTIVSMNDHLRNRVNEMTMALRSMMTEINSLNWHSLSTMAQSAST